MESGDEHDDLSTKTQSIQHIIDPQVQPYSQIAQLGHVVKRFRSELREDVAAQVPRGHEIKVRITIRAPKINNIQSTGVIYKRV